MAVGWTLVILCFSFFPTLCSGDLNYSWPDFHEICGYSKSPRDKSWGVFGHFTICVLVPPLSQIFLLLHETI